MQYAGGLGGHILFRYVINYNSHLPRVFPYKSLRSQGKAINYYYVYEAQLYYVTCYSYNDVRVAYSNRVGRYCRAH